MANESRNKWINGVLQAITTLALVAITSQVLATKDDVTIIQGQIVTKDQHREREALLANELGEIWAAFYSLKGDIKDAVTNDEFHASRLRIEDKMDDLAQKVAVLDAKIRD